MLKRSRAPSPSPTRAIPSSPPPLDDNPHVPLPKRRRTVGPIIDSSERRDGAAEENDEDDEDIDWESDGTSISTPDGKVYEHVNHFLHCLHTENQYRSRTVQLHPGSSSRHPYSHIPGPSIILPHDPLPCQSSASSPARHFRDSQSSPSAMLARHHEGVTLREVEETAIGCSNAPDGMTQSIPNKTEVGREDERMRVRQRYEETNRFVSAIISMCVC